MRNILKNATYLLAAVACIAHSAPNTIATSCFEQCVNPHLAASTLGTLVNTDANCQYAKQTCHVDQTLNPDADAIVHDFDGTFAPERFRFDASSALNTLGIEQNFISDRPRSLLSTAFGVFAPLLMLEGYGEQLGLNMPPEYNTAAKYLANYDELCETGKWANSVGKFYSCINSRMAGMSTQSAHDLMAIMFKTLPQLQQRFTTTLASLNYFAGRGFHIFTQTGGTKEVFITLAQLDPQPASRSYETTACDFTQTASATMNQQCLGVWDNLVHSEAQYFMTFDLQNVCVNSNAYDKPTPQCIDDGEGKVSGLKSLEEKSGLVIKLFYGNSGGDIHPAHYVLTEKGGFAFIHNNDSLCEQLNDPEHCFNVHEPDEVLSPAFALDENFLNRLNTVAKDVYHYKSD